MHYVNRVGRAHWKTIVVAAAIMATALGIRIATLDRVSATEDPPTVDYDFYVDKTGPGSVELDDGTPIVTPDVLTYESGTWVTIDAIPDTGQGFVHWLDENDTPILQGNPSSTVVMNSDRERTAVFGPLLTVNITGNGEVSPNGGGFEANDLVTLTASANIGSAFDHWEMGGVTYYGNTLVVTMDVSKTIEAVFTTTPELVMLMNGNGAVTPGTGNYPIWSEQTLSATPDPDWIFDAWTGDVTGSANPTLLTMYERYVVTANFLELFDLNSTVSGQGVFLAHEPGTSVAGNTTITLDDNFNDGDLAGWTTSPSGTSIDNYYAVVDAMSATASLRYPVTDPNSIYWFRYRVADDSDALNRMYFMFQWDSWNDYLSVRARPNEIIGHRKNGGAPTTDFVITFAHDTSKWYTFQIIVNDNSAHVWHGEADGALSYLGTIDASGVNTTTHFHGYANLGLFHVDDVKILSYNETNVNVNPSPSEYPDGSNVDIESVPAPYWVFSDWSGDMSGSTNPDVITITADANVTSTFTHPTINITTSILGDGSGTITPDLGVIPWEPGNTGELTAIPDAGHRFIKWSDEVTTATRTIADTQNATYEALIYEEHSLTTSVTGQGSIIDQATSQSPDGTYTSLDTLSLEAQAAAGWQFMNWSGDETGNANPTSVTIDEDKTITAEFIPDYLLTVSAPGGGGTASKSPDQAGYKHGDTVTVTATPDALKIFGHWQTPAGEFISAENPYTFAMTGDTTLEAIFVDAGTTIITAYVGDQRGSVTFSPTPVATVITGTMTDAQGTTWNTYTAAYDDTDEVDEIYLTAVPDTGYTHEHWTTASKISLTRSQGIPIDTTSDGTRHVYTHPGADPNDYYTTLTTEVDGVGAIVESGIDISSYQTLISNSLHPSGVKLHAEAETGWTFIGWEDGAANLVANTTDVQSTTALTHLDIDANGRITPDDAAFVMSALAGIDITPLNGDVNVDSSIDLTDYALVSANMFSQRLTAVLGATTLYTLTTGVNPASSGVIVQDAGPQYGPNEIATVTAFPEPGYAFDTWQGDVYIPDLETTPVLMDQNKTITADFKNGEPPVITLLGDEVIILDVDEPYVEPGFTANDPQDGDVTANVIEDVVYTGDPGWFYLTYDVIDSDGNAAVQALRLLYIPDTSNKATTDPNRLAQCFNCRAETDDELENCWICGKPDENGIFQYECCPEGLSLAQWYEQYDDVGDCGSLFPFEFTECTPFAGGDLDGDPDKFTVIARVTGEYGPEIDGGLVQLAYLQGPTHSRQYVVPSSCRECYIGGEGYSQSCSTTLDKPHPTSTLVNTVRVRAREKLSWTDDCPYNGPDVEFAGWEVLRENGTSQTYPKSANPLFLTPVDQDIVINAKYACVGNCDPATIDGALTQQCYVPNVQTEGCGTATLIGFDSEPDPFYGGTICHVQYQLTPSPGECVTGWFEDAGHCITANPGESIIVTHDVRSTTLEALRDFPITAYFSGGCTDGALDPSADHPELEPLSKNDELMHCLFGALEDEEEATDPIYYHNGEFYEEVVDLMLPRPGADFEWKRKYRSRIAQDSAVGNSWDFNYNIRLERASYTPGGEGFGIDLVLCNGLNRRDLFKRRFIGGTHFWAKTEHFSTITYDPGLAKYTAEFEDKSTWTFHGFTAGAIAGGYAGKIEKMSDRHGNMMYFFYDAANGGRLAAIYPDGYPGDPGRKVKIEYNGNRIQNINAFAATGASAETSEQTLIKGIEYYHEQSNTIFGQTGALRTVSYRIGDLSNPLNVSTSYTYDGFASQPEHKDNLITIAKGNGTYYLRNFYSKDESAFHYDRVVRQVWGDGADITEYAPTGANASAKRDQIDLVYVPGATFDEKFTTILNDRAGRVLALTFDARNRLRKKRVYAGFAPDANRESVPNPNGQEGFAINGPIPQTQEEALDVFYETRYFWNQQSRLDRIELPDGGAWQVAYRSDLNAGLIGIIQDFSNGISRGAISRVTRFPSDGSSSWFIDYKYGPDHNFVTEHTDANGHITKYTINGPKYNITQVEHPNGKKEVYTYTDEGLVETHKHAGNGSGYVPSIPHDPNSPPTVPDGHQRTDFYEYDANGELTKLTLDYLTSTDTFTLMQRNAMGKITSTRDPNGQTTYFRYHSTRGLLEEIETPSVEIMDYENGSADINGDGATNAIDIQIVINVLLGNNSTDDVDVNGDGSVNAVDLQFTINEALGIAGITTYKRTIIYDDNLDMVKKVKLTNKVNGKTHPDLPNIETEYWYDILGNIIQKTATVDSSSSVTTTYAYTKNRKISELRLGEAQSGGIDANNITKYVYNSRGDIYKTIQGEEGAANQGKRLITEFRYTRGRSPASMILNPQSGDSHKVTYAHDGFGRIIKSTDAVGGTLEHELDNKGNITRRWRTGVASSVTSGNYILDDVSFEYDYANNVTKMIRLQRDPLSTGGGFPTSHYVHSPDGNILMASEPGGIQTFYTYDNLNRVETVEDKHGNKTTYEYDKASNVTKIIRTDISEGGAPANTVETNYEYDNLNRLTKVTDGAGKVQVYGYDSLENVTRYIEAHDPSYGPTNHIDYAYDGLGRLIETTYIRPQIDKVQNQILDMTVSTKQSWDASNRLKSQTDDAGNITTYQYDSMNRLKATIDPSGLVVAYTYNDFGELTEISDSNGTDIQNTPDNLGRITSRTLTTVGSDTQNVTGTEQYVYDGLGRVIEATTGSISGNITVKRRYGTLGGLILDEIDGNAVVASFHTTGELNQLDYPSATQTGAQRHIKYGYDDINRLETITAVNTGGTPIADIAKFDYIGRRTEKAWFGERDPQAALPGASVAISYKPGTLEASRVTYNDVTTGGTETPIDDRTFNYDFSSNMTGRINHLTGGTHGGRTHSYGYNTMHQMVSSVVSDTQGTISSTSYYLDNVGNRTSVAFTDHVDNNNSFENPYSMTGDPDHIKLNQYSSTNGNESRSYDGNGNLRVIDQTPGIGGGEQEFFYDYRNRLVKYIDENDVVTEYSYDALDRRVRKTINATAPTANQEDYRYYYYGWHVVDERKEDPANTNTFLPHATYVYGGGTDNVIQTTRWSGTAHVPYFFAKDPQGNVVGLMDEAGAIVERYDYGDFGTPLILAPNWTLRTTSSYSNELLFTGRRYDKESGLYHYRNRYYEPGTGRFITRDPIGTWGDPLNIGNPYTYVGHNPWSWIDPYGLMAEGGPASPHSENPVPEEWAEQWSALVSGSPFFEELEELGISSADLWICRHIYLDLAGLAADLAFGQGVWFDAFNAMLYLSEGNLWDAFLSGISMVPGLGDAVGKGLRYGPDVLALLTRNGDEAAGVFARNASKGDGLIRAGDDAADTAASGSQFAGKGGCFVAGTLVLTRDGLRPIEEIEARDEVWAFDFETDAPILTQVNALLVREVDSLVTLTLDGEEIVTTSEHPFWVNGEGWINASALLKGDIVNTLDESDDEATVESTALHAASITVYNLDVAGTHNYYVGKQSIFVHNMCAADADDAAAAAAPRRTYESNPKHRAQAHGNVSPEPTNPRAHLDSALPLPGKSNALANVDRSNKEFIIYRETGGGVYHAYAPSWGDLTQAQQAFFRQQGWVNKKGKIR